MTRSPLSTMGVLESNATSIDRSMTYEESSPESSTYNSSATEKDVASDESSMSSREDEVHVVPADPGTAPEEVYERSMSSWRFKMRRFCMQNLDAETEMLARMQHKIRTPLLDTYFVYTSSLGTHTFFMTGLPMLFFFGLQEMGRGLIFVLGMGVYLSSFIKDVVCAPRPYAPPVARLTMGSHHLEYGFPSTHSTNSVSIALYIYSYIHSSYFNPTSEAGMSDLTYLLSCSALLFYVFSIVFGRLYTGMHSFTDCVSGVLLGSSVFAAHNMWWIPVERWIVSLSPSPVFGIPMPTWAGAIAIIVLAGILIHRHPQPVDDCPCFEDAIAFVSVIAGSLFGLWLAVRTGYQDANLVSRMRGLPLPKHSDLPEGHEQWGLVFLWWGTAITKVVVGITAVFAWRIFAKAVLRLTLPPLFRLISYKILPQLVSVHILPKGAELPNRRFYTPATEYNGPVPLSHTNDGVQGGLGGLRPFPSVLDLPGSVHEGEYFAEMSGANARRNLADSADGMKRRRGVSAVREKGYEKDVGHQKTEFGNGLRAMEDANDADEVVKHYDADVITKAIVYSGIAIIATTVTPIAFEVLGWGVHP